MVPLLGRASLSMCAGTRSILWGTQRPYGGAKAASSWGCPHLIAPTFTTSLRLNQHCQGPPIWAQGGAKQSKRLKKTRTQRNLSRVSSESRQPLGQPQTVARTGWTLGKSMGDSSKDSQSQQRPLDHAGVPEQAAGTQDHPDQTLLTVPSDDPKTATPPAALVDGSLASPEQGPFFYIGGSNGAAIISSYCKERGWQRTQDSRCEDYMLKWCEIKTRASYCAFREGEQLLYQLPNNKLLTTKIGLLSVLREYSRSSSKVCKTLLSAQARLLKMEEFFPETYRLDIKDEREAFFTLFDDSRPWICKPTASNQGKGIFLLRTHEEVAALQATTQSTENDPDHRKMPLRMTQARVVQRYIQNPLLLEGRKFDVRSYLLIACTMPYMIFFGHGYARLTLSPYDLHSRDLSSHLTNQFMQKKSPLYGTLKEDTVWSMEHLNRYINDKFRKAKGLPQDWVFTTFTRRMQQIMLHCFLAVRSKLECKLGYFDLIGCDFLIDEDFKVWLLEMNSNPALHTNCGVLKDVIPNVVVETLDLALETFQKSLHSQKMRPLLSQRHFVLLYSGETDLWPRPWGPRGAPHLLPPFVPSSLCASSRHRLGARRPGHPRPPLPPVPNPEQVPGGDLNPDPEQPPRETWDGTQEPPEVPEPAESELRGTDHRGS